MRKPILLCLCLSVLFASSVFAHSAKFKGDVAKLDDRWTIGIKLTHNNHLTQFVFDGEGYDLRDDQFNAAYLQSAPHNDVYFDTYFQDSADKGNWKKYCDTTLTNDLRVIVYNPEAASDADRCVKDTVKNWIFITNKNKKTSYDIYFGGGKKNCKGTRFGKIYNEKDQSKDDGDNENDFVNIADRVYGNMAIPANPYSGQVAKVCHNGNFKTSSVVLAGHRYRIR